MIKKSKCGKRCCFRGKRRGCEGGAYPPQYALSALPSYSRRTPRVQIHTQKKVYVVDPEIRMLRVCSIGIYTVSPRRSLFSDIVLYETEPQTVLSRNSGNIRNLRPFLRKFTPYLSGFKFPKHFASPLFLIFGGETSGILSIQTLSKIPPFRARGKYRRRNPPPPSPIPLVELGKLFFFLEPPPPLFQGCFSTKAEKKFPFFRELERWGEGKEGGCWSVNNRVQGFTRGKGFILSSFAAQHRQWLAKDWTKSFVF